MKKVTIILFLSLFFSCKKEENAVVYYGEVVRGTNDCNTPKGFPYIIKYIDSNNNVDSLITSSLPSNLRFVGTKISFSMYDYIVSDEAMFCNSSVIPPKQKSLYNIK